MLVYASPIKSDNRMKDPPWGDILIVIKMSCRLRGQLSPYSFSGIREIIKTKCICYSEIKYWLWFQLMFSYVNFAKYEAMDYANSKKSSFKNLP